MALYIIYITGGSIKLKIMGGGGGGVKLGRNDFYKSEYLYTPYFYGC